MIICNVYISLIIYNLSYLFSCSIIHNPFNFFFTSSYYCLHKTYSKQTPLPSWSVFIFIPQYVVTINLPYASVQDTGLIYFGLPLSNKLPPLHVEPKIWDGDPEPLSQITLRDQSGYKSLFRECKMNQSLGQMAYEVYIYVCSKRKRRKTYMKIWYKGARLLSPTLFRCVWQQSFSTEREKDREALMVFAEAFFFCIRVQVLLKWVKAKCISSPAQMAPSPA